MKKSIILLLTIFVLCALLCSCKSKSAVTADNMISNIGEVTLDSETAIVKAEDAVAALSEKDYEQLENLEALQNAREKYNDLLDQDSARQIVKAISNIKEISMDTRGTIQSIRSSYDNCTDGAKKYVNNYDDLVKAEEKLSAIMVKNVIARINSIGVVTLKSETAISEAQILYNNLSSDEKLNVTNAATLTNAVETLKTLKANQDSQEAQISQTPANSKKDKCTVNTNGKQIWQVYANSSEIHFDGTFHGSGYFGIKVLDSNQDFFDLVANEIGDYNVNKTIYGLTPDQMYYIQIECTDGQWSCSWTGTYGQ